MIQTVHSEDSSPEENHSRIFTKKNRKPALVFISFSGKLSNFQQIQELKKKVRLKPSCSHKVKRQSKVLQKFQT